MKFMAKSNFNSGTIMYYNLSPKEAITVQYVIEMKEKIDGESLRQALDITMMRYPYLAKRIVVKDDGYHLVENDLPVVIKPTHHIIPLCGPDANYHQLAFSYSDYTIYMVNTHSIFDGRGRSAFFHTLIYYYCKIRYNEEIEMEGVNLIDTPIDPSEYYDPFDFPIPEPEGQIPQTKPLPQQGMQLAEMGLVHKSHTQIHHLSIDEAQLMERCKQNHATPNSALSVILSRAIARLHPDSKEPIIANIACDPRTALHAEHSHHPLASSFSIEFTPDMRELDFEQQNEIFRSEMSAKADPSTVLTGVKAAQQLYAQINALPTLQEKLSMAKKMFGYAIKSRTFSISYSGKSNFGSCDKHMAAIFPQLEMNGIGIAIEVSATNGKFFLTFAQEWKEDVYFNAFLKELTRLGIDYDLLYSARLEPVKIEL